MQGLTFGLSFHCFKDNQKSFMTLRKGMQHEIWVLEICLQFQGTKGKQDMLETK